MYVFCTWSVAIQFSNLFLEKKFSLFSAALNRKKLGDTFFPSFKWVTIAPTEFCVTYLPSDCPS